MHGISSLSSITLAAFCCFRVFLIIIMMPRERLRSLSLAGLHRKTKQVLLDRYSRHFIDAILYRITRCQSEADNPEGAMPFPYLQISNGIAKPQVHIKSIHFGSGSSKQHHVIMTSSMILISADKESHIYQLRPSSEKTFLHAPRSQPTYRKFLCYDSSS